jgi:hypothetical protein
MSAAVAADTIDTGMPCQEFVLSFVGGVWALGIHSDNSEASVIFQRFQTDFPAFKAGNLESTESVAGRVDVIDCSAITPTLRETDPLFTELRDYLTSNYEIMDPALVDRACSPALVPTAELRDNVAAALSNSDSIGLACQRDCLVISDHRNRQVTALVDVAESVKEYYGYHVLNFFKIFFFRHDGVRLHGSSAVNGNQAVVFLANSQTGKSTLKNFYLQTRPGVATFTDDSIIAVRDVDRYSLYQDPVEFLRWCYMPDREKLQHAIPEPRDPIQELPVVYYLQKGEETAWHKCRGRDVFDLVASEAFFQKGFLTQRFIPQPDQDACLEQYFRNSRDFLDAAAVHLLSVKYHDDYSTLFATVDRHLGL